MSLLATASRRNTPSARTPKPSKSNPVRALRSLRKNVEKSSNEESIKVAVRIRPLTNPDDSRSFRPSETSIIESIQANNVLTTPRRVPVADTIEHVYDNVFSEETDTSVIYNELVSDIVNSVKNGINGTVFTYGQTSSGKTYTMQGQSKTPGIIQYAARDIFDAVQRESNLHSPTNLQSPNVKSPTSSTSESTIKVSFVEVYNEELRDLLSSNTSQRKTTHPSLVIREDKRGTTVEGLNNEVVKSVEQLMEVFRRGESKKAIGSTKMNDRSSRSHAIFRITIERKTLVNGCCDGGDSSCGEDKENAADDSFLSPKMGSGSPDEGKSFIRKTSSTLNLVDLAGSESVRLTGAIGMQKKEGGMINQSLLTLSKVLMSLGQKNPGHVNYRDSKLTRILKPSLSGNARMALICCISPSSSYIDETRSTLQFATRAKLVKTNATANEVIESDADVVNKLRMDLRTRRSNEILEGQEKELKENAGSSLFAADGNTRMGGDEDLKKELHDLKRLLFDSIARGKEEELDISDTTNVQMGGVQMGGVLPHSEVELLRNQVKDLQHQLELVGTYQEIETYKSQTAELQAKLSNTNNLISSMGKQINELSSHKDNDEALSAKTKQLLEFTIEEAMARTKAMQYEAEGTTSLKSEIANLERHLTNVRTERDELALQNDELRAKGSVDSNTIIELEHRCHLLKSNQAAMDTDREEMGKLGEMNEELKLRVSQLEGRIQNYQDAQRGYEEEKRALVERLQMTESELSSARPMLEAKSRELDDMMLSLENEKQARSKDIESLHSQIKEGYEHDNEKRLLMKRAEAAENEVSIVQSSLKETMDELEMMAHMLDKERREKAKEVASLQNQIKAHDDEKLLLVRKVESAEEELSSVRSELDDKSRELKDAQCMFENEKQIMAGEIEGYKSKIKAVGEHDDEKRLLQEQVQLTQKELSTRPQSVLCNCTYCKKGNFSIQGIYAHYARSHQSSHGKKLDWAKVTFCCPFCKGTSSETYNLIQVERHVRENHPGCELVTPNTDKSPINGSCSKAPRISPSSSSSKKAPSEPTETVQLFACECDGDENSTRPKRKLKATVCFDPGMADSRENSLKTTGFNCPRCDFICDYGSTVCSRCQLECYYEAGVGVAILKDRGSVGAQYMNLSLPPIIDLNEDVCPAESLVTFSDEYDSDRYDSDELKKKISSTKENDNFSHDSESKRQHRTLRERPGKKKTSDREVQQSFVQDPINDRWLERYEDLLKYKEKHGNTRVPYVYKENLSLGRWVSTQRKKYKSGKLSSERIEKLEGIEFVWDSNEYQWLGRYEELVQYVQTNEDTLVPRGYKDNPALGMWVDKQRLNYKSGKLSPERIQKLEEIGFNWDPHEYQWEERYSELVQYVKKNQNSSVTRGYNDNKALGRWVSTQRTEYKYGNLSSERVQKLEQVGFVWYVS